jgi:integrase
MIQKIRAHERYLATRKRGISRWKVPARVRAELVKFVEGLELGKVNRGKRISEGRQAKYLDLLRVPLQFICKPSPRIRVADIERFEKALSTDRIQSRLKGKPYAASTKVDMRKALKIFLRWRLGQAKALQLAGWLDTHDHHKTPDYLTEAEVETLLKACNSAEQRFLVAVLFDSGARAEEFINIRLEDVRLPEGNEDFVKLTLKQEYSKTLGRTISLYWRQSLDAVRDYLKHRTTEGIKPGDPLYPKNYDTMRFFLARLGRRVLRKHVHPHLFRHSSATYYATKLNRQELCYRYGWRFSSNMPDIYISRAGMENKDLDVKFTNMELGSVKDDLTRLQQQNKIKDERIESLQGTIENMQQNIAMISELLAMKPTVAEVEKALARKKGFRRA